MESTPKDNNTPQSLSISEMQDTRLFMGQLDIQHSAQLDLISLSENMSMKLNNMVNLETTSPMKSTSMEPTDSSNTGITTMLNIQHQATNLTSSQHSTMM